MEKNQKNLGKNIKTWGRKESLTSKVYYYKSDNKANLYGGKNLTKPGNSDIFE